MVLRVGKHRCLAGVPSSSEFGENRFYELVLAVKVTVQQSLRHPEPLRQLARGVGEALLGEQACGTVD